MSIIGWLAGLQLSLIVSHENMCIHIVFGLWLFLDQAMMLLKTSCEFVRIDKVMACDIVSQFHANPNHVADELNIEGGCC